MGEKKESFVNRMKKFFKNYGNIGKIYNKKIKDLEAEISNPHISELERGKKTKELKNIKMEKKKAKQAITKAFIFGASGALALGATANIMLNNINKSMSKNPPNVLTRESDSHGPKIDVNSDGKNISNSSVNEIDVNERLELEAKKTLKDLRNRI